MSSLSAQLQAYHDALIDRIGPENAAVINRALADLSASDLVTHARKTGETAPDFTLTDQSGATVTLSERLQSGPVAMFFYRGGWSPLCELTLRAWQARYRALLRAGGDVIAVSPDSQAVGLETATSNWIDFPLLSDTDNQVADLYGVAYDMPRDVQKLYRRYNLKVGKRCCDWRLPISASYVIAPDRTIRAAHVNVCPFVRMDPGEALRAFQDMQHLIAA